MVTHIALLLFLLVHFLPTWKDPLRRCLGLVTICGEAPALFGGHAWFVRRVHVTVDVGAAGAPDDEGLSGQHPSYGPVDLGEASFVSLENHPAALSLS